MQSFVLLFFVLVAASLTGASPTPDSANVTEFYLPFEVINGTSTAEVISVDGGIDNPKMTPGVNNETFDWWHFDVVGDTRSLTVVFYNFGENSLDDITWPGGPLLVQVTCAFDNGTTVHKSGPVTANAAFSSSNAHGVAAEWRAKDGSLYTLAGGPFEELDTSFLVAFYSEAIGVSGWVTLTPRSPAHYPCDFNNPGVTQEIMPDVYWSNAVPSSDTWVALKVDGEAFKFDGFGYHDKNWGFKPLRESVDTWYRGHAYVGNYNLVWFDALGKDGREYFSSFITDADGGIITKSCQNQSVVVRPWGKNSDYPPRSGLPAPSGYRIRYDLGGGRAFTVNFTTESVQLSTDSHKRVIGTVSGGFEDELPGEGRAMCEQFQY